MDCLLAQDSSRMLYPHLVGDARFGQAHEHEWQDSDGIRLVIAASRCRSSVRRSMVRQAGHWTHRKWCRFASTAPIVGANRKGLRRAWRSFQASIKRVASFNNLRVGRVPGGILTVAVGLPFASTFRRMKPTLGSSQVNAARALPAYLANETRAWAGGATRVEKLCGGTSEPRSILKFDFRAARRR
jgi:hypothetical protein